MGEYWWISWCVTLIKLPYHYLLLDIILGWVAVTTVLVVVEMRDCVVIWPQLWGASWHGPLTTFWARIDPSLLPKLLRFQGKHMCSDIYGDTDLVANYLHGAYCLKNLVLAYIVQHPEGLLPCLQEPITAPCTLWLFLNPVLILFSHLHLGLPSGFCHSCCLTKILCISHLSHVCYMPSFSQPPYFITLILYSENYECENWCYFCLGGTWLAPWSTVQYLINRLHL
jgi:hypothetical protein